MVTVRRFKCDNPACALSTFSEQVPHLTTPFARRTPVLTEALVAIALALAGRAGARLATTLGMPCGRDLLIKMIRALPAPEFPAVKVLGVDDFAIRRRHTYNTILIDMATHRPIDVLPDREAATLAAWLVEHPGVEVVCRDRGGAYAEGARTGAPDAIQVADRSHLWQNLCEAVGKTVNSHYHCLRVQTERATPEPEPTPEPVPATVLAPEPALPPRPERRLAIRTRERFEAVQSRLAAGMSRAAVGRELNLDPQTVRRFADATTLAELLVKCENRVTKLDSYREQVHALWNAGVTDAAVITERRGGMRRPLQNRFRNPHSRHRTTGRRRRRCGETLWHLLQRPEPKTNAEIPPGADRLRPAGPTAPDRRHHDRGPDESDRRPRMARSPFHA